MIYIIIEESSTLERVIGYFDNLEDLEKAQVSLTMQARRFIIVQRRLNLIIEESWR